MARRSRKVSRETQKRSFSGDTSICEGHEHFIHSIPVHVRENMPWMSVILLLQYFRENGIDVKKDARHEEMLELLFNDVKYKNACENNHHAFTYADFKKSDNIDSIFIWKPEEFLRALAQEMYADYSSENNSKIFGRLFPGPYSHELPDYHGKSEITNESCYSGSKYDCYNYSKWYDFSKYQSEFASFRLMRQTSGKFLLLTPKGTREIESVIADIERWHALGDDNTLTNDRAKKKASTARLSTGKMLAKLQKMSPDAFEYLCRELLLKSGVEDVRVTGRTGDEGIDGQGVIRIRGLTSIPVVFQAKRYSGSVGVSVVRDFRGAMDGRANTGFLITTGTFTNQARSEASRQGAIRVDLIDGNAIVSLLNRHDIALESL